ncbi:hypothetical protein Pelo_18757 [Pelomyxa schiedti]|nr:hypothetical protein Pelo_18757 [Pelomyxa schiedti]
MVVDDTSAVPGGPTYTGRVVDGKRDGRGTLKWPSCATYDGVWLNGDRMGRGAYKWHDGATHEGEWLNSKRDGWGVKHNADGGWGGVCKGGRQPRGGATGAMAMVYEGEWDSDNLMARVTSTMVNLITE